MAVQLTTRANGQVERMNRTIKEATVKRFFYDTHEQLKAHLSDFIAAYNFALIIEALRECEHALVEILIRNK